MLQGKFGDAKSVRDQAKTYYDPDTQTSYNLHTHPDHGAPHVDVRQRGTGDLDKIDLE